MPNPRACFDKIVSLVLQEEHGGDEHGLEGDEHGFWDLLREAFESSACIRVHHLQALRPQSMLRSKRTTL